MMSLNYVCVFSSILFKILVYNGHTYRLIDTIKSTARFHQRELFSLLPFFMYLVSCDNDIVIPYMQPNNEYKTFTTQSQSISIDVTRNSVLNGKTQLIEAVQTKVSYFILLKITYRFTNWTPYRHCIG